MATGPRVGYRGKMIKRKLNTTEDRVNTFNMQLFGILE